MKSLFEKKTILRSDIDSLIENKAEESLHLEFKAAGALEANPATKDKEDYKTEIGRDVSAFANADGGILIYGLSEKAGRAHHITWLDGKNITKEWLQQVIEKRINRTLTGLEIIPIRNNDNEDEVIYVVKVQQSPQAPHMAYDKCYYCRTSIGRRVMEEYEVRNGYFRTGKTELEIYIPASGAQERHSHKGKPTTIGYHLQFFVYNLGYEIEKMYKLEIKVLQNFGQLYTAYQVKKENITLLDQHPFSIISVHNTSPLFPEERTLVVTLDITVEAHSLGDFRDSELEYTLYYSNGKKNSKIALHKFLHYKGRPIEDIDLQLSIHH